MICRFCPAGRRVNRNGHRCVFCRLYGIVVLEGHECTREGWKDYERNYGHAADIGEETELPEDGGRIVEIVPGILSGPGEREGFPGMDADKE